MSLFPLCDNGLSSTSIWDHHLGSNIHILKRDMSSNFQSRILILNKCKLIYEITFSLNKALEKIEKNNKIAALYAWIVECFLSNNKKLPNGKKCNVHKAQCLTSYYVLLMQKILLLLDPWKKENLTPCFGFEDFKKKKP